MGRWSVRITSVFGIGVCILLVFAGFAGQNQASTAGAANGPVVNAKFADLQAEHTATTDTARLFAKLVAQYTNNHVQITVYPNAELGTPSTMLQGVVGNTIQFYATPDLSAVVPDTDVLELPYLFPSAEVASKVLNGPTTRSVLWNKFTSHGLQVLGAWSVGYSDILTVDKAVRSPSDMKGLRIRIFDPNVGTQTFALLQADGVTMASTQVVTALSTHAVDGADDPPSTMYGSDWYGSAHYLAITDTVYVSSPVTVNSAFLAGLSPEDQAAVRRAYQETLAPNLAAAAKYNRDAITKMAAAGITVTYPDQAQFRQALLPVYGPVEAHFPGIVQQLQQAIKAAGQ